MSPVSGVVKSRTYLCQLRYFLAHFCVHLIIIHFLLYNHIGDVRNSPVTCTAAAGGLVHLPRTGSHNNRLDHADQSQTGLRNTLIVCTWSWR